MADPVDIFGKIIGIYSLALVVFGTVGNLFSLYVCLRKNLRTIPTFIFYAFMLVSDALALYFWNLDNYLLYFNGYYIETLSLQMCSLATFLQAFSLYYSAWLLVLLVFERLMAIKVKTWRVHIKPLRCILISVLTGLVIFAINLVFVIQLEIEEYKAGGNITLCFYTQAYGDWSKMHIFVQCVFPFSFILVANILLIHGLVKDEKRINASEERKSKRKSTSITVLITTTLFIITKAPSAIASTFFLNALLETKFGFMFLALMNCISFTYYSLNVVVLKLTNKNFSRELKIMIGNKNNIHPTTNGDTNTRQTHG